MKRVLVLVAMVLGGCSAFRAKTPVAPQPVAVAAAVAEVERVPFRLGVSSATVERMAKQHACTGGPGAGLVTEPGPVEVYRMQCDSGKVFMARCELRQCKPM